ncbi:MAG: methyltransferase domain-containing protein [Gemmatimonadota bacterium]|nr:methyltransferase domain-containing protein [Gemmatimonadota bacterium]
MTTDHAFVSDVQTPLAKTPGHWVLAKMGKRVLRPGGLELTERMLDGLAIGDTDDVVELAPGLGVTARLALDRDPASYTGVERDSDAARRVSAFLDGPDRRCLVGRAQDTGLADGCASVVYCEAMLTMQTPGEKKRIVQEAFRILRPGGRYGIHELCLQPDDLDAAVRQEIGQALTGAIHVGARPLTRQEWRSLLEEAGFTVGLAAVAPMHLLEPRRLIRDEGWRGAARFLWNVARTPEARRRVQAMRGAFREHADHLGSIALVATKP